MVRQFSRASEQTPSSEIESFYTAPSLSPSLGSSSFDLTAGPQSRKAIIVAVMGATGAGKSTFIKVATGCNVEVGTSLNSCTQEIKEFWCRHPTIGCDVCFIDTPGFDDTYLDDTKILERIANWLLKQYQGGAKLSGVLYLHSITDNRMPHSSLRTLDIFQKICGTDALSNIGLVTTHWDEAQRYPPLDQCHERERELYGSFWKPLISKGARTMQFDNSTSTAWNIINSLPLQERTLQIQREMGDKGMSLPETSAGRTLFSWLWRATKHLKEMIARIMDLLEGSPAAPLDDNHNAEGHPTTEATMTEEPDSIDPRDVVEVPLADDDGHHNEQSILAEANHKLKNIESQLGAVSRKPFRFIPGRRKRTSFAILPGSSEFIDRQ